MSDSGASSERATRLEQRTLERLLCESLCLPLKKDKKAGHSLTRSTSGQAATKSEVLLFLQPALQLIYDTAPIGLARLSPDCRYLQINQRLTETCGISVEDHLGRSVRDCVPALEGATGLGLHIVHSMVVDRLEGRLSLTGEPGIGTIVRLILPRSIKSASSKASRDRLMRQRHSDRLCPT
jgi:PAS domain-containing protein